MKRLRNLLALCAALVCSFSQTEAFLASVKNTGMGQAGFANPQDALAGAYNPAGMAWICDRFDIGFEPIYTESRLNFSGSLNPSFPDQTFNGLTDHWVYNVDFGINKQLCDQWTLGFVLYNNDFVKTKYNSNLPLFNLGDGITGLDFVSETFGPVLTYSFEDPWCNRHAFGITLDIAVQRLSIRGINNFDHTPTTSEPGRVTNNGFDYSSGAGFTIGWQAEFCDWLRLGLCYQPRIRMARFKKYSGFLPQHGRIDIPALYGVGIAVNPWSCLTVAFDVRYLEFKHVRTLGNILPPDFNPLVPGDAQLGTPTGLGFGWKNQVTYRLGAAYDLNECWTVRAGWRFGKTPVRRGQEATNALTQYLTEHYLTVGATWYWNACTEISGFYAHGFKHHQQGNNVVPIVLGGGNVGLEESKDAFGISWGHNF